jgi:hypothetical protein
MRQRDRRQGDVIQAKEEEKHVEISNGKTAKGMSDKIIAISSKVLLQSLYLDFNTIL